LGDVLFFEVSYASSALDSFLEFQLFSSGLYMIGDNEKALSFTAIPIMLDDEL
jgi:hypothetical protein